MQHKIFLNIFLLYSSAISAMELTTTNNSFHIQNISDDLFSTAICSRLDRPARDTLRCTCKKYVMLIYSQDELNNNYAQEILYCSVKVAYWRSLGGCYYFQEFGNAVKDKKDELAQWLLDKKIDVCSAYCSHIKEAVETSKVDEVLPIIKWLLYTQRPDIEDFESLRVYFFAHEFKKQYPEVQKIIDLFNKYKQKVQHRDGPQSEETSLCGPTPGLLCGFYY